ncbi:MAG: type II toxin-antitoxin system HicB family antitoxin [Actinomycetes bacterium]|jgi:hypothetical protein|nr:type II toxin-antitoxin system HicB family antitoxin [Actinomycetes bacterium]
MSAMSIRLPQSLHNEARELAKEENISVNQLVASALAEKLSALKTESYLARRAQRGSVKSFHTIMDKVPDVEPASYDRLG